jgi:hypothetical protein
MTYCTGTGCKSANKCRRYTDKPQSNEYIYCINPSIRVHCLTKQPIPIVCCDLFLPNQTGFSKVLENDIGG